MAGTQVRVRGPRESDARSDVVAQRDSDRLVHEEAELGEEPTETRVVPLDGKDQGPVCVHTLFLGEGWGINLPGGDARM
jgi:hypothetical protein